MGVTSLGWAGVTPGVKAKTTPKTSAKTKSGAKSAAAPTSATNKKKTSAKGKISTQSKKTTARSRKGAWKRRGQQAIASDRTRQIQEALIHAGYLTSEPTGKMDASTKQALVKLQKENGWQSKVVPDSRALIRLGLGPDHSNLLNPDTAVLPEVSSAAPVTPSPQR
ncbi:MAG: peptidoglycan-binding domain-containing protein [Terriglobales bacterium]